MKNNTNYGNDLLDVFDAFFTDMGSIWEMPNSASVYNCSYPPLDLLINEKSKDLKFKFALAGFEKSAISLTFEGDYLQLIVDPSLTPIKEDNFELIQKGIKLSRIDKKFYVPSSKYQTEKIEVKFENGILEIVVPAKVGMQAKKIKIS